MTRRIIAAIEWIGGQGTRAVAAVLLLGLALPPLSAVMRPLLPAAVFLLLVLAFVRVDAAAVAARVRRPHIVMIAVLWIMLIVPLCFAAFIAVLRPIGLPDELAAAIVLMTLAPPVMSSPALTYLLGLEGALSVAVLVAAMVVTPITTPVLVDAIVGEWVGLSATELAVRLSLLLAGSFIVAMLARRWIGVSRIASRARLIDGLNIIILFGFAVAIMDGVVAHSIRDPLFVLAVLILAFGVNLLLLVVSTAAFLRIGIAAGLTIGITNANRNMGLMAAAMAGAVPEIIWLFFALGQFPIFLLPQLIKPAVIALLARVDRASHPEPQRD